MGESSQALPGSEMQLRILYGTWSYLRGYRIPPQSKKETQMDKNRSAANQAKGAVKEVAGKTTGDKKLQTEGTRDKAKGQVQSAVGGAKDTLRGK
jgi:uncharacterized protein YjbJ (UPF0337 family)